MFILSSLILIIFRNSKQNWAESTRMHWMEVWDQIKQAAFHSFRLLAR